jgi:hypothetical protein
MEVSNTLHVKPPIQGVAMYLGRVHQRHHYQPSPGRPTGPWKGIQNNPGHWRQNLALHRHKTKVSYHKFKNNATVSTWVRTLKRDSIKSAMGERLSDVGHYLPSGELWWLGMMMGYQTTYLYKQKIPKYECLTGEETMRWQKRTLSGSLSWHRSGPTFCSSFIKYIWI